MQTGKSARVPCILMHAPFWRGLLQWMRERLVGEKMINPQDMEMVQVIDEPERVVEAIFKALRTSELPTARCEREILLNL